MISVDIPGNKILNLENLVLDYNGTLAIDGIIINGVKEKLNYLSTKLNVHVITADTFGKAAENLSDVNCNLTILKSSNQQTEKQYFIKKIGASGTVAIGNGLNDSLMLKDAALGIVLIQQEGAAVKTLLNADVVCYNILDALDLLQNPLRLKATLRT